MSRLCCAVSLFLSCLPLAALAEADPAGDAGYEVFRSHTVVQGGRRVVLQRVSPPPLPPAAEAPLARAVPLDAEALAVREARRARWLAAAPLETRLISLQVTVYPSGWSYLEWQHPDGEGLWQRFEAWSTTDFRSLWMVQDLDAGRTRYVVFPSVFDAGARFIKPRAVPGPVVPVGDGTGFFMTRGDATAEAALRPIRALHALYKKQGPALHSAWVEQQRLRAEEAVHRTAAPPPPGETVIRFWPVKSKRYATRADMDAATQPAAPAAK